MADAQFNGGATQCASVLQCTVCERQMRNPHMLPCLHAFCLACLQDECSHRSRDKFFCPVCVDSSEATCSESVSGDPNSQNTAAPKSTANGGKKSVSSRPWHSFDTILENEVMHDALQRRLAELPATKGAGAEDEDEEDDDDGDDDDDEDGGYYGDDGGGSKTGSSSGLTSGRLEPPAMFPCSNHSDKLADQYCTKCEQIACPKCTTSFHRRCSQGGIQSIRKAVESRRRGFDSLHNTIAGTLTFCEEARALQTSRVELVESTRSSLLHAIKAAREQMVAAILAKEHALGVEVNRLMDRAKKDAEEKSATAGKMAVSLGRQLDVMSFSIGAGAEGELLPYLPGLEYLTRSDTGLALGRLQEAPQAQVVFQMDQVLEKAVKASPLGFLKTVQDDEVREIDNGVSGKSDGGGEGGTLGLTLTLMTSFHGGSRDDISEPLLTDLVLLANGDVILTDRDNQCVKKFNQSGKLLTRVLLDASPSRIAVVSQGRAVVSTTSRRQLYFLSLQGTVRVLSSVRVKKLYTFLTALGGGMLAAGTNYGDCLDIISEGGQFVRTICSSKPDRAGICRPFYITPVQPLYQQGLVSSDQTSSPPPTDDASEAAGLNSRKASNSSTDAPTNLMDSAMPNVKSDAGSNSDKTSKRKGSGNDQSSSGNNGVKANISSSSNNNNSNRTRKNSVTSNNTATKSKPGSNGRGKTSPTSTSTLASSSSSASLSTPAAKSPSSSPSSLSDPNTATSTVSDSPSPDDLWVTDSARKILYRLRQKDGKTTFTLKSRPDLQLTLECPLGVTVHPSGLPLLVDRDSDTVHLLDKGGNYLRPALTAADGLTKPCAIYAGYKGHVALSQVDGMVKIYSSKLQYF